MPHERVARTEGQQMSGTFVPGFGPGYAAIRAPLSSRGWNKYSRVSSSWSDAHAAIVAQTPACTPLLVRHGTWSTPACSLESLLRECTHAQRRLSARRVNLAMSAVRRIPGQACFSLIVVDVNLADACRILSVQFAAPLLRRYVQLQVVDQRAGSEVKESPAKRHRRAGQS